jgi:mitochondrial fission protein ELM1
VVDQFGPERLRRAGERLRAHPRFRGEAARGTVAVLIGGGTALTTMPPDFAEALVAQVQRACGASGGRCLVTTSRRTGPAVERCLAERLDQDPRCALLLLAGRDALDGTLEGLLGSAEVIVVTGESISMVSEACASGRRVLVVEPPRAPTPNSALFLKPLARLVWGQAVMTKHQRFLRKLEQEGRIRIVTVPELSRAIQRALAEPSLEPLETFSAIRHAVARLL